MVSGFWISVVPRGKSTHLSSLISDNGFLVANEVIKSRQESCGEHYKMGIVIL